MSAVLQSGQASDLCEGLRLITLFLLESMQGFNYNKSSFNILKN